MTTMQIAQAALAAQPFSQVLGARLTRFEDGIAECEITIREDLKQQHGFVHGGAVSALADMGLAFAGGSVFGNVVSVEMKLNWVRPALGDLLIARGEIVHRGKTQAVALCKIYARKDGVEKLCAIAQGTIAKTDAEIKG